MGVELVVDGPPVVKAASDQRLYQVLKLANGLSALLIHDPAMSGGASSGNGKSDGEDEDGDEKFDDDDGEEDEDEDEEDSEEGEESEDGEGDMEVDDGHGHKHGHVHHAGCKHGKFTKICFYQ